MSAAQDIVRRNRAGENKARELDRKQFAERQIEAHAEVEVGDMVMFRGGKDHLTRMPSWPALVVEKNSDTINLQVFGSLRIFPRCNIKYGGSDPCAYETWHFKGETT